MCAFFSAFSFYSSLSYERYTDLFTLQPTSSRGFSRSSLLEDVFDVLARTKFPHPNNPYTFCYLCVCIFCACNANVTPDIQPDQPANQPSAPNTRLFHLHIFFLIILFFFLISYLFLFHFFSPRHSLHCIIFLLGFVSLVHFSLVSPSPPHLIIYYLAFFIILLFKYLALYYFTIQTILYMNSQFQ